MKYIWKKCYKNFLGAFFWGAFFWAPIPFKQYQNTSGCGTDPGKGAKPDRIIQLTSGEVCTHASCKITRT